MNERMRGRVGPRVGGGTLEEQRDAYGLFTDLRMEVCLDAKGFQVAPARIVVQAAVTFVQSQRDLLRSGLEGATDDEVVADVSRRHDASHEAWIATVASLRQHLAEPVVASVVGLYGFHGRVAGGLAGERSLRLEGPIETGVRRILADQLDQMTVQVVDCLQAAVGITDPAATVDLADSETPDGGTGR